MRYCVFVLGVSFVLGPILGGCGEIGSPVSVSNTSSPSPRPILSLAGAMAPGVTTPAADSEGSAARENAAAADYVPAEKDPLTRSARIANTAKQHTPLRILVVGAHPADVFDQSGGTMAHHVARGDWAGCAVLTHGVRVHDKVVSDDMFHRKEIPEAAELNKIIVERADAKSKEVIKACSILGVKEQDVYFLGADDAVLLANEAIVRKVARLIRKLRPNVIITHYPLENAGVGSQHATTGQIVMHAINLAAAVDPGDKTPPCEIAQVFFFGTGSAAVRSEVWGAQGGFYNDIFVDITDVAEKKIACLDAMASQGYGGDYARKRIEASDGAFGSRVKVPYAEGFISCYSTTQYYLPVSEINLEHSKDSNHEAINRSSYRVKVP
ncbi:MAG: PIG-L family deacetylase [Pirellulales bacterium]|nr:PIG-L family deacetylase [Pirellulales bacterium]